MDQGQLYKVQLEETLGPALGSQQSPASVQFWGRMAGKMPGGKDLGMLVSSSGT